MKVTMISFAIAAALCCANLPAATFNYHGRLLEAGTPAEGNYDLELTLFSSADGGKVIGGPLTMYKVPIHAGNFHTEADFGPIGTLNSTAWVGVKIRKAGSGDFSALTARSAITADTTAAVCPGAWTLGGNANGANSGDFLGTTDVNDPLILMSGGSSVATFTLSGDSTDDSPNVLLGDGSSGILSTVGSATIGGGRGNNVSATDGTIGGGDGNGVYGQAAVVAGGAGNSANGVGAAIGGGYLNKAGGNYSSIPGGFDNLASGFYSFAAGEHAHSLHDGAFVWGDTTNGALESTATNQFDIRATGGVAINGTPATSSVELTIHAGSADAFAGNADIELLSDTQEGYELSSTHGAGASSADDSALEVGRISTSGTYNKVLQINASGSLQTFNNAPIKPTAGAWFGSSDRRIKHDIMPLAHAIETLMQLRPVNFRYNADYRASEGDLADTRYFGFVAQEFGAVFPDAVISTGKRVPGAAKEDAPILGLDPTPAFITAVAAVQELSVHDQVASDRIAALERQNALLRQALDKVTARLDIVERKQGE